MDEMTGVTHEPDTDQTPILSALASPAVSRPAPPRLGRLLTPAMLPEPAPAAPLAEKAVPRPAQYRLEILDALTDDDVDTFVETGFAEEASFGMNADGLWEQNRLEADVSGDADEK